MGNPSKCSSRLPIWTTPMLSNTPSPFLVFTGKDLPSNLEAAFNLYGNHLKTFAGCRGERQEDKEAFCSVTEFLTRSYGLSGPAGVHPCLYCLATKVNMQTKHAQLYPCRTLSGMDEAYKSYASAGHILAKAKSFQNCIRSCLFSIIPTDTCVLVLHLDLLEVVI